MIDNSTKYKLENETPHFGNTLLCPVPLRGLGKKQKKVLKLLANGWHITIHTNFSKCYEETELSDEDDNIENITAQALKNILISFCRRDLLFYQTVYTTVQPDTETAHYKLKKEYVELVRHWA